MSWLEVFRTATHPRGLPLDLAGKEKRPFAVVAADVRSAARRVEAQRLRLADAALLEDRLSAIGQLQHCDGRLAHYKAAARTAGAREGLPFPEIEARLEIEIGEGEREAQKGG